MPINLLVNDVWRKGMNYIQRGLMVAFITLSAMLALSLNVLPVRAETPVNIRGSYLVDPQPFAQTPKYLGVCLEVAEYAEQANLWDWLADSGAKMARVIHPDKDVRVLPASEATYEKIQTRTEFDAFRKRITATPEQEIPWKNYRFDQRIPWLGIPDVEIRKLVACGVSPMVSMAYAPHYYQRSILKAYTEDSQPPDENINWDSAASAYEYYFANIYRYAKRDGVTHYMMFNEPGEDERYIKQVGVLARVARMAMDDVKTTLTDKQVSAGLRLSGPACHYPWEAYWKYTGAYVDFMDFHYYDSDPEMFKRQQTRMAIRARQSGKKLAFTEFNRIGGALQPDQALFSLKPSLQLGGLIMSVLSANQAADPGCEAALLYEFQSPATHRSFKSLAYGDMNVVDWTGQDKALNQAPSECYPTLEELQLRVATPAYHVFKMLARCTPGNGPVEAYEVLALGESSKGLGPTYDPLIRHNVYKSLDENKYYALGGVGQEFRLLAVRTPDRLYLNILNPGPTGAKGVGFDLELLKARYATAVVRETSLWRRDEVVRQMPVKESLVVVDVPPESLTQIILTQEDLEAVSELKLDETTTTPGTVKELGLLQTTRLRALAKLGEQWMDLSDLGVVWSSSDERLVKVYQSGLVQRVRETARQVVITAKTPSGSLSVSQVVMPDQEGRKLAPVTPWLANGGFEKVVSDTASEVRDWTYREQPSWETGLSPAQGWVCPGSKQQWSRSLEQNHTSEGRACLKAQFAGISKASELSVAAVPERRTGFELGSRHYRAALWVYRPSNGGLSDGRLGLRVRFDTQSKQDPPVEVAVKKLAEVAADTWVEVEQTLTVPADASRIQVSLFVAAEAKQTGTVYVDDVALNPTEGK